MSRSIVLREQLYPGRKKSTGWTRLLTLENPAWSLKKESVNKYYCGNLKE